MGVFRHYLHAYYVRRLKLPPSTGSVPDVLFVGISRIHPRNNLILRDGTFRKVNWRYYTIDRVLPPSLFVPGIFSAKHPRLKNSWARSIEFRYYRVRRVLPPVTPSVPDVSGVVVSKVHPSRNRRLRDTTFRPASLAVYHPKRTLPPSLFVPGIFLAKHPRLKNNWVRGIEFRYYRVKRALPPITPSAADVSSIAVSKVHPSRNRRLRDTTFRPASLAVYQPKRVMYPSVFVAGILILVSKVHPSRNRRLRDATFRPPHLGYYQPSHVGAFNLAIISTGLTEVLFKGMWRGMFKRMR